MSAQAIAQYFAQVGILVDTKSIASVDSYLGRVEKSLARFQNKLEKSTRFNIRFHVDRAKLLRATQSAMNQVSRSKALTLDFNKFNVKTLNIVNNMNKDFKKLTAEGRGIKLDARLSQKSLVSMKRQMQDYMSKAVLSPRVVAQLSHSVSQRVARASARAAYGSTRTPTQTASTSPAAASRRERNPYHNPMLVGGATGAVMRYGMYALPLYGGVMGVNAIANRAAELQGQSLSMQVAMGTVPSGTGKDAAHYEKFLANIGKELGLKTQDIQPMFAQMLSGSLGTDLEPHLEQGFANLLRFGTVMGISDESMKLSIKAFSQMIL